MTPNSALASLLAPWLAPRRAPILAAALLALGLLAGCQPKQDAHAPGVPATLPTPDAATLARLGKAMFFDTTLSASGRQSCASCHDPDHGYGPPNRLAVQLGGPQGDRQGKRATPGLAYTLNATPIWTHVQAASVSERLTETDNPPKGGLMWDGRFNSLHDQAGAPLLDPDEMANGSRADVVARLARAAYADDFRAAFGQAVFDDTDRAFDAATRALERFELDDPSFRRFDSKFDAYLDGKAALSAAELRGLKLFADPAKGNCAACHLMDKRADGSHPLFTDFQFAALGVPRNPGIAANADPAYFDLGLCGPRRTDQIQRADYCGMFKTPTLRNTARRGAWFHNGRFHSLEDAVRFYVERDLKPAKWYSRNNKGQTVLYDDLPPAMRRYVDHFDPPFDRQPGARPALNDAEIRDVVAFLKTLDDGYAAPAVVSSR
ncbi:cytochrome-c peroxidase [Cupriavidus pauculus]|uniref:Cytochrome-c peroxidase n=1 Tax=Cupriavidus pauculus TaxID=82633 RepID=A0A2N5C5Y7_9BURK|nr:cytochrome c peroxidase [Cupriavidus pauculus]PLP97636.1 cytochrome-c peroxidase [Cupriavidus pauculus]